MLKQVLSAAALSALATLPLYAQSQSPPDKPRSEQKPGATQSGAEDNPLFIKIIPSKESRDKIDADKNEKEQKPISTKRLSI